MKILFLRDKAQINEHGGISRIRFAFACRDDTKKYFLFFDVDLEHDSVV